MSHTVTVQATKITDRMALRAAVARLGTAAFAEGNRHTLFSGTYTGLGIRLRGWNYPVVVQENGSIVYDNFEGHWGHQTELDKLLQAYLVEKAKTEARLAGQAIDETVCENGDIVLRISSGF